MARPPPGRHRRALLSRTALRRAASALDPSRAAHPAPQLGCVQLVHSCRDCCRVSASTRGRVQVPVLIGGVRDTVFLYPWCYLLLGVLAFVRYLSPLQNTAPLRQLKSQPGKGLPWRRRSPSPTRDSAPRA